MNHFKIFLLIFGIALFSTSCDQEIDINDDWEDVGVIYGLLDADQRVNWVRIERGYLGTEPASASFSSPDSLYYDTLQVFLYGIDDNGVIQDTRQLVKDQSINLDSGLFTTEDYRLYRTDDNQRLQADLEYLVRIIKIDSKIEGDPSWTSTQVDSAVLAGYFSRFPETKAQTALVGPRDLNSTSSGYRFNSPNPNLTGRPIYTGVIRWFSSSNAEMYEIDLYFFYREMDTTTGITESKSFKSEFETQVGPFTATSRPLESNKRQQQLYEAIAANVPVNDKVLRFYDKMRIEIWAGGEQLRRFVQLNEPSSSLSQTRPEFAQVQNGTGMLSSRTKITVDDVDLSGGSNGIKNTFYLDPTLCDRNFTNLSFNDTCVCEFFAGQPSKECF